MAENTTGTLYDFEATDAEGDAKTLTLCGGDKDAFVLNARTGVLTVASGTTLSFENKKSYSLNVTASDRKDSDLVAFTLAVTDVDEPPAVIAAPTVATATARSPAKSTG